MPAPVIKDLNHPDFPHGESRGWRRGCRRLGPGECVEAKRRDDKAARLRASRPGHIGRALPEADAARIVAEVDRRIARVPGATRTHAARSVGVGESVMRRICRTYRMAPATAAQLMRVTVSGIAAEVGHTVSGTEATAMVRKLQALGYPVIWQGREAGVDAKRLVRSTRNSRMVEPRVVKAIVDLMARVGDAPADPVRDGITPGHITKAKAEAAALGYYPPACYDEDGTLNVRAIPGHPWARADEMAHDAIEVLRIIVARNEESRRNLMAKRLGVLDGDHLPSSDRAGEVVLDEATADALDVLRRRLARMKALLRVRSTDEDAASRIVSLREDLDEWEATFGDPVEFVLRIGLLSITSVVMNAARVAGHPGVLAYLAMVDGDEEAA